MIFNSNFLIEGLSLVSFVKFGEHVQKFSCQRGAKSRFRRKEEFIGEDDKRRKKKEIGYLTALKAYVRETYSDFKRHMT